MAKWTINTYNQRIDKTKTVQRIGRNGIHYEYVMPLFSDPMYYYNEAIDVKSKKSSTSTYRNGKKPGQYQPVGDKSYFNYYQLKKMYENNPDNDYIIETLEIISQFYKGLIRGIDNELFRNR